MMLVKNFAICKFAFKFFVKVLNYQYSLDTVCFLKQQIIRIVVIVISNSRLLAVQLLQTTDYWSYSYFKK